MCEIERKRKEGGTETHTEERKTEGEERVGVGGRGE